MSPWVAKSTTVTAATATFEDRSTASERACPTAARFAEHAGIDRLRLRRRQGGRIDATFAAGRRENVDRVAEGGDFLGAGRADVGHHHRAGVDADADAEIDAVTAWMNKAALCASTRPMRSNVLKQQ